MTTGNATTCPAIATNLPAVLQLEPPLASIKTPNVFINVESTIDMAINMLAAFEAGNAVAGTDYAAVVSQLITLKRSVQE